MSYSTSEVLSCNTKCFRHVTRNFNCYGIVLFLTYVFFACRVNVNIPTATFYCFTTTISSNIKPFRITHGNSTVGSRFYGSFDCCYGVTQQRLATAHVTLIAGQLHVACRRLNRESSGSLIWDQVWSVRACVFVVCTCACVVWKVTYLSWNFYIWSRMQ